MFDVGRVMAREGGGINGAYKFIVSSIIPTKTNQKDNLALGWIIPWTIVFALAFVNMVL